MFLCVVMPDSTSISSCVLSQLTKTTDFRSSQNVSVKRGSLVRVFGLSVLQGCTSSPDYFVILGDRNGTHTTYRLDIYL